MQIISTVPTIQVNLEYEVDFNYTFKYIIYIHYKLSTYFIYTYSIDKLFTFHKVSVFYINNSICKHCVLHQYVSFMIKQKNHVFSHNSAGDSSITSNNTPEM